MINPSMPFYPADFMAETALFTNAQIGRLFKVMCVSYINGGKLTKEEVISICSGEEDEKVFGCLKRDEDGRYYHERTLYEIKKREEYAEKKNKRKTKRQAEKKPREKKVYGKYGNVLLTDEQYEKLSRRYRDSLEERIKEVDDYLEMSGKSYKNHAAVIDNWEEKRQKALCKEAEIKEKKERNNFSTFDADEFFWAAVEKSERLFEEVRQQRKEEELQKENN